MATLSTVTECCLSSPGIDLTRAGAGFSHLLHALFYPFLSLLCSLSYICYCQYKYFFVHIAPSLSSEFDFSLRFFVLYPSPPDRHYYSMGFFDHLQRGGFSLQPKKPQIRQVVQSRPAPPSRPSSQVANKPSSRNLSAEPRKKTRESASRSASGDRDLPPSKRRLTPLRNRKRPTPEQRLSSDDDDEGSDTDTSLEVRKRARTGDSAEPDYGRRLRSVKAFSGDDAKSLPIVHAAEITSVQKPGKFKPAFGNADQTSEILLQYPSATPKERYGCSFSLFATF